MLHIKKDSTDQSLDIINRNNESFSQVEYPLGSLSFTVPELDNKHIPFLSDEKLDLGLLPSMVRYISPDHKMILYERQPEVRHVSYQPMYKANVEANNNLSSTLKNTTISLPWQVYIIALNNHYEPIKVHLYARPSKMKTIYDKLYVMPLLNLYSDCSLCAPLISSMSVDKINSVAEAIDIVYHMVWSSGFNYDLISVIQMVEARILNDNNLKSQAARYQKLNTGDTAESFFNYWALYMTNLNNFVFCNPSDNTEQEFNLPYTPQGVSQDNLFMPGEFIRMKSTFTVHQALATINMQVLQDFGSTQDVNISDYITAATEHGSETIMST